MELIDQLQQTLILKGVEKGDLELLLSKMERRSYPTGTVIFERGDDGNEMFIILAGRIRIYTYDEYKNALTLRHYGTGEIFGELSPLDQQTRSASAAARKWRRGRPASAGCRRPAPICWLSLSTRRAGSSRRRRATATTP